MYLQGTHIQLRALEPEDVEIMYTIENDTSLWEVSNRQVPYSRSVIRDYIQGTQYDLFADRQLRLIMALRTTGEVVGTIDLTDFDPQHARAEVGVVVLAHQQGKGYASEGLRLICDYAFRFLRMEQLFAHIATDNEVSLHLFESCGFSRCGIIKRWWNMEGEFKDVHLLQRLRDEEV